MKTSIARFISAISAALLCASFSAAESQQKSETSVLPASAYRKPLDEIVVEGQKPYWQGEAAPRWDRPKVEAPKPGESNDRLQWAPRYSRDERDDYNEPRDQLNHPTARGKLFELKF